MSKLGALVRRLGLDNVPLHATATAESLALARILMLAIWIVYVVQDPVQSLTFLPQELFHAFGVFQLVPGTAWAALLTPTGLFALKSVLIGLFAWAMFGFRGARVAAAVALADVSVTSALPELAARLGPARDSVQLTFAAELHRSERAAAAPRPSSAFCTQKEQGQPI